MVLSDVVKGTLLPDFRRSIRLFISFQNGFLRTGLRNHELYHLDAVKKRLFWFDHKQNKNDTQYIIQSNKRPSAFDSRKKIIVGLGENQCSFKWIKLSACDILVL